MTAILRFDEITDTDAPRVGGKGLSLGLLAKAELPVPGGFCITTEAYKDHHADGLPADSELSQAILSAYHSTGSSLVAVRSSATAEDGSSTSFAGQQETILGVEGDDALLAAVEKCWASLKTERAIAYRKQQGVAESDMAMAVVVQKLVPAEVAGVLFTRDPTDSSADRMLVEASWGLGESVVSGSVSPDRFQLSHDGSVLERHLGEKATRIDSGGKSDVPDENRCEFCLDDDELHNLADLGRQVESFYGDPRDIEWAFAEGRFWLLQARPITTADGGERELVRQQEIDALRALAPPEGTVWSKFNLAEVLPTPTPMTWDIVRYFMSGQGGFGQMYRDLGFEPDPSLDDIGIFDLICGRPYCNLTREPKLLYSNLPYEHSFERLRQNPSKAFYPEPKLNPSKFPWWFWLFSPVLVPWSFVKMLLAEMKREKEKQNFGKRFREEVLPKYLERVDAELKQDYSTLEPSALVSRLDEWIEYVLVDIARESLKPTALASLVMGSLQQKLVRHIPPAKARETIQRLIMGVRPKEEADLPGAMKRIARGDMTREQFLDCFGHRGSQEMELAQPRWEEDSDSVDALFSRQSSTTGDETDHPSWEAIGKELSLSESVVQSLTTEAKRARAFVAMRESSKHYLMKGYSVLRRILLELDSRFSLKGGIFFLTREELPRLVAGENLVGLIDERRKRRSVVLSLDVPRVLFSTDLDVIGNPPPVEGAETLQGIPLSAGIVEGQALVTESPALDDILDDGYILVCPSTDPAWVPLFVHAKGLVMETGGVLSHGAIVAREFGLPAVAGLPGVLQQIQTGQRIRIDGSTGEVSLRRSDDGE